MLWSNLLYEAYIMIFPRKTLSEKNNWVAAEYQTFALKTSFQFGEKKYTMPSNEPGSVNVRTKKIIRRINGAMPVMYAALPALLTPFMRIKNTIIHTKTKNPKRFRIGHPIPS